MFSPEEASEAGAVKTMLAAGAYLNSDAFARSLIALPTATAPMYGGGVAYLDNQTCKTFLIWRDGSSLSPPTNIDWINIGPNSKTCNHPDLAGPPADPSFCGDTDVADFVRICGSWYKISWKEHRAWYYRIKEVPACSGNFVLEGKYYLTGNWFTISSWPGTYDPEDWSATNGDDGPYWGIPPEGECQPCTGCGGGDPGQGGGELP
jgi:hypothetical protein